MLIKHDADGYVTRSNQSTGIQPISPRAGFVFYSEALHIAQECAARKTWDRWAEEWDNGADLTIRESAPMTRAQLRALALQRIAQVEAQNQQSPGL